LEEWWYSCRQNVSNKKKMSISVIGHVVLKYLTDFHKLHEK